MCKITNLTGVYKTQPILEYDIYKKSVEFCH